MMFLRISVNETTRLASGLDAVKFIDLEPFSVTSVVATYICDPMVGLQVLIQTGHEPEVTHKTLYVRELRQDGGVVLRVGRAIVMVTS